jgi:hypothetical protein
VALFHVSAAVISKGTSKGGSVGFATYIAREDIAHTTQHQRYLVREGREGSDLVACGHGGLPSWANDARDFWLAADRYERKNGTVARTYQVSIPRELSPAGRLEVAEDIRRAFFARYPHTWAVHCPTAKDGMDNPHVHVVMSERRDDGIERTPKAYFARAASAEQDPARHGAKKDRSWQGPSRLREFRAGVAVLINSALEREGQAIAVSHESLRARGHARAPEKDHGRSSAVLYMKHRIDTTGWQETLSQRERVQQQYSSWENDCNLAQWYQQKETAGMKDLGREAVLDHVRDRFWRHDKSSAREQEREVAVLRAIAREYPRTGRARVARHDHRHEPTHQRTRTHSRGVAARGLEDVQQRGVHLELER